MSADPRWHELFVDDDGSPTTVWLMAEGRSALDAAMLVHDCIGLDGDGFSVSMVHGLIEPVTEGEWRFRKPTERERREGVATIPMWELEAD